MRETPIRKKQFLVSAKLAVRMPHDVGMLGLSGHQNTDRTKMNSWEGFA